MNWYKKAQNEPPNNSVRDMVNGIPDPNEPLGKKIFEQHGVWQYPFNQVQKDNTQGWFINWYDSQGGIPDIDSVNNGDKVADSALNMTPYWEVSFVDSDKGIIFLNPIQPNPFVSGVGAGGKEITDWDMEIHSGEYEGKRIDQILKSIQEGTATDPNDVAYLLKGTVPLQMGPNGAQGGWYHPGEVNYNRGGREGMRPKDIMMVDAKSLQKMGYATPIAALDGSMNLDDWNIVSPSPKFDTFYKEKRNTLKSLMSGGERINFKRFIKDLIAAKVDVTISIYDLQGIQEKMQAVQGWRDRVREIQMSCRHFKWEKSVELLTGLLARVEYAKPAKKQDGLIYEHLGDMDIYLAELRDIYKSAEIVSKNLDGAYDCLSRQLTLAMPKYDRTIYDSPNLTKNVHETIQNKDSQMVIEEPIKELPKISPALDGFDELLVPDTEEDVEKKVDLEDAVQKTNWNNLY